MCDTTNFFPWLEMQDGQLLLSAYLLCANMADLTYIKYTWFWVPILKCSPIWPFFFVKGIHRRMCEWDYNIDKSLVCLQGERRSSC